VIEATFASSFAAREGTLEIGEFRLRTDRAMTGFGRNFGSMSATIRIAGFIGRAVVKPLEITRRAARAPRVPRISRAIRSGFGQ